MDKLTTAIVNASAISDFVSNACIVVAIIFAILLLLSCLMENDVIQKISTFFLVLMFVFAFGVLITDSEVTKLKRKKVVLCMQSGYETYIGDSIVETTSLDLTKYTINLIDDNNKRIILKERF